MKLSFVYDQLRSHFFANEVRYAHRIGSTFQLVINRGDIVIEQSPDSPDVESVVGSGRFETITFGSFSFRDVRRFVVNENEVYVSISNCVLVEEPEVYGDNNEYVTEEIEDDDGTHTRFYGHFVDDFEAHDYSFVDFLGEMLQVFDTVEAAQTS